jgi:predicted nuclease with TOPRIM domain
MTTDNESVQPVSTSDELQRRVERLESEVSLMNQRFDYQQSEIAYLKKALRELEYRIDFPPGVTFCPTCGTAFKTESSLPLRDTKADEAA